MFLFEITQTTHPPPQARLYLAKFKEKCIGKVLLLLLLVVVVVVVLLLFWLFLLSFKIYGILMDFYMEFYYYF